MSYYWAYQAEEELPTTTTTTTGGPPGGPPPTPCPQGQRWDWPQRKCVPIGPPGPPAQCPPGQRWDDILKKCIPLGGPPGPPGGPPGPPKPSCGWGQHWDYRKHRCVRNSCLPWEHWDDEDHRCRGPWPPKCRHPEVWDWWRGRCDYPSRPPKYRPVPHIVNEDIDINVDITGQPASTEPVAAPEPAPASDLLSGDCMGLPIPCALLMVGGIGALIAVAMVMKK